MLKNCIQYKRCPTLSREIKHYLIRPIPSDEPPYEYTNKTCTVTIVTGNISSIPTGSIRQESPLDFFQTE